MPGWSVERYDEVDSTQDVARARLVAGRVVVAGWQRAGRGRHGRVWTAPPGRALLFSAVLSPSEPVVSILPLLAGVAVRDAIAAAAGAETDLKWPNDVLAGDRKVAGILVERPAGAFAVLGIGINANLEEADLPAGRATSLLIETGHPVDLEALLAAVLARLDEWLAEAASAGAEAIVAAWRKRTRMFGQPVEVLVGERLARGVAEDITEAGALVLRHPDGRREVLVAGEVRRVR